MCVYTSVRLCIPVCVCVSSSFYPSIKFDKIPKSNITDLLQLWESQYKIQANQLEQDIKRTICYIIR